MMTKPEYTIRPMVRGELDIAVEWAAAEGWNPGLHDADCYFSADPNGFLIGLLGEEPIASISAVKYGKSFGFIGFYIVKPEYRGLGYGMQIWNGALSYLDGATVGLDGVVAQQENYKKSGFELAYRNVRYEGVTGAGGTADRTDLAIVELATLPLDLILKYDTPFFPEERSVFTNRWLQQPDSHALGFMQDGTLLGYGLIRACRTGYKIGPLFAEDAAIAERLLTALQARVDMGKPFFLDVPEVNSEAVALAEKFAMKVSFETARMYRGEAPELPLKRIFGVTSFEIG